MGHPGLDDAFLRYINATPENQRRIQSFYLPFFVGCQGLVVDLACGHGDFVQLLTENGVDALGIDSDPECCRELQQRGIDVLCEDVLTYLQGVTEESLSGLFSAHLVEHLPYQQVMALIELAHRALEPGGIIVLTTPNVRGLYPHLESFYMHFGHVTFYHPRLLGFFLDYSGFSSPRLGENPRMARPLWRGVVWREPDAMAAWSVESSTGASLARREWRIPSQHPGAIGRAISKVKTYIARLLVRPLLEEALDDIDKDLDKVRCDVGKGLDEVGHYVRQLNVNVNATHQRLMDLDRSVECYVYATKGDVDLDLPPQLIGEAA
ncbi:MAG: class I SAM-dependent methyltransferase [Anaerolineae bacterium]|jgi:SAM-dependent methyltransferase